MSDQDYFLFLESNGSGIDYFRAARGLGYRTAFVARDISRYEAEYGKDALAAWTDQIIITETHDDDLLEAAVRRHFSATALAGVATISEYYLVTAAVLAARLGLPGAEPAAMRAARNKQLFRDSCRAAGLPVPDYVSLSSVEEADKVAASFPLPCVIKPTDGSASRNVRLCRTPDEVRAAARDVFAKDTDPRGHARCPVVLAEEFIPGPEVSAEIVLDNGAETFLGVTGKKVSGTPWFVEVGHDFPACLPPGLARDCQELASQAARCIGYGHGFAHIEIKLTTSGPVLIELNARPAGDRITRLIELATEWSPFAEFVRVHSAAGPPSPPPGPLGGASVRFITAPATGILHGITGTDLARRSPWVTELAVSGKVGTVVGPARHSGERLGHLITAAPDPGLSALAADAAAAQLHTDIVPLEQQAS